MIARVLLALLLAVAWAPPGGHPSGHGPAGFVVVDPEPGDDAAIPQASLPVVEDLDDGPEPLLPARLGAAKAGCGWGEVAKACLTAVPVLPSALADANRPTGPPAA